MKHKKESKKMDPKDIMNAVAGAMQGGQPQAAPSPAAQPMQAGANPEDNCPHCGKAIAVNPDKFRAFQKSFNSAK